MTILIFIIVLGILILVHEFGHFLTAKWAGMKVEEFGIGFPPKLLAWKPKNSETEYSINLIPFGGFVKILGENREEEIPPEEKERSFENKPAWKRAVVLFAGVFFNFLLAWLLIAIVLMLGSPSSTSQLPSKYIEDAKLTVTGVLDESPADESGLKAGDNILYIESSSDFAQEPDAQTASKIIAESEGPISVFIKRGKENKLIEVEAEVGIIEEGRAIGVGLDNVGIAQMPFFPAIYHALIISVKLLWAITVGLVYFFVDIFQGAAGLDQVSGPVGIVSMIGDAARIGLAALINFTALISLHLAILNLLPIPALDGGRLLFIGIEKIKGSKVNPKVELWVNAIGFILLIILMIVITFNDILKLF